MTILFAGGEDSDLTPSGLCSVSTNTAYFRSTKARCALSIGVTPFNTHTEGWTGTFSTASSEFWFTGRFFGTYPFGNFAGEGLVFLDGLTRRLYLTLTGAGTSPFRLTKRTASGTNTILQDSSYAVGTGGSIKIDVYVRYTVTGQVKVYMNNTLVIDYSGNVTTDSATTLSGFICGKFHSAATAGSADPCFWSEIIAATVDTRSFSLVTLPCNDAGNTTSWTDGTDETKINEITTNDATIISSDTANQVNQFTIDSTNLAGNPGIVAVTVNARAQKGATGPANAQLMVRTYSTDYVSSTKALQSSLQPTIGIWETNPNTGLAWTDDELMAVGFNVGIKSIA